MAVRVEHAGVNEKAFNKSKWHWNLMNAFQKLMLISCAVIFILAYFHVVLWWDEAVYVNNAYSIIGVTENWRFVAWERQPGISILEAIAISGFGEIGFAVVAFAGALGLVVLAYLLAKENGGSDTQAVFAGMIMLFSPAFWASGYTFASDAWGAVTSLAAFLFYLRYMRTERATEFYLALLLAGISFWFRDLCIITGGCIILWEFLFNKKAGYKILPGLGIYSLILGIYF
ncbi:MAG: glycosyltransferase family 39 protein, partial [Candidatus Burarchaeum sp.]|nr:glycosyltransferase family 39 protein [Candidatus Burarchaeum sp.]